MIYENIHAIMEFTEVLKNEPEKAYDFISCNAYRFTKEGLTDILKELLYSISYHTNTSFYMDLYKNILLDVQKELDENYHEAYEEYDNMNEYYYELVVSILDKDENRRESISITSSNDKDIINQEREKLRLDIAEGKYDKYADKFDEIIITEIEVRDNETNNLLWCE